MQHRYPEYKQSELPWVGEIPAHWGTKRARYLFREVDRRSLKGEETHLSMSQAHGLVPSKALNRKSLQSESYAGGKLVAEDDLVLNRLKAHLGVFARARQDGVVSPDYSVFRPSGEASVRYCEKLFKTAFYVAEFRRRTKGIVEGFWRLYTDDFYGVRALVPPKPEQDQIVRYLDAQDAHIARFIRVKRKLIALLKEQRRNIIRRAVTKGVKPPTEMKVSGIEWLPSIPSHWSVGSVRSEFQCLNRRRAPLSATERGHLQGPYDYYGASGVIDHVVDFIFDDELLLIAEDGANLVNRNLPLAIVAKGKFWVNNHAHILKPRKGSLEYFAHLMECIDYRPWISGAAQPKLTKDRLLGIRIPVPSPTEQEEIVRQIKIDVADPESAIQRATDEIALLIEFRDRQIADVVTGQIDVRSWQPGPEDLITEEDLTALGDDDDNDTTEEETDGDDGHD